MKKKNEQWLRYSNRALSGLLMLFGFVSCDNGGGNAISSEMIESRLLEQLENALGHLIGLGQHGLGGLDEDVVLDVGHHLLRHIGVPDAGLGVLDVLLHDGQVVHRVLQAVLHGAQLTADVGDCVDGRQDDRNGRTGTGDRFDIDCANTQRRRIHYPEREAQLVIAIGGVADLELKSSSHQTAVEQLLTVEVGAVSNTVDLSAELVHLLLELLPVKLDVGAVGGLNGQLVHAVEHVVDLGEGALGGLHQGDAVVGVVLGLVQAGDLGPHLLGDGQPGGVVAGAVDLVAGAQLLQVLGQGAGVVVVVAIGIHRHNIVLNAHDKSSCKI